MRISEEGVFYSIQGEGLNQNTPTTFIRLQGCNLKPPCKWCDTPHSWDSTKGEEISIDEILDRAVKAESRTYKHWVCITGGEPLLQESELHTLVKSLKRYGFRTEIETNGSLPKPSWYTVANAWSIDYKCPSSGHENSFREEWWDTRYFDMVKFVVEDMVDLDFAKKLIMRNMTKSPTVILSPVHKGELSYSKLTQPWLQEVWEACKELKVRFNLQQHKIVFGNKKGV